MNNPRRTQIRSAMDLILQARELLDDVRSGEQEAYDNMPESFQVSEKGERMENSIAILEDAAAELEDMESNLEEALG